MKNTVEKKQYEENESDPWELGWVSLYKMGELFDKISRVQADGKRGLHVVLYFLDFFICQWKYPSRSEMIY